MILWGVILIIVAFVAVLLIIRPFVNKQNDKKMKNKSVEDYLKYYLSLESPQYAVMIKGPWGCGKTFFVKEFLDKNKDEETGDGTVINLKPIYISLNGMRTLEDLQDAIRAELNPLLYSKTARIGKTVLKGLLKTTLRIDLDLDKDGRTDGALSGNLDSSAILTLVGKDVTGTKALFLDDLERTKIELDELFGFLNNLVEHYSCKIILIADENRLIKKISKYLEIKEKLIGPAFEIALDVDVLFNNFLDKAVLENPNYGDIKKYLEENKKRIIEIYKISQCANLRILRRSIVDFLHFSNLFHFQLKNKNNYDIFMNRLIIIFFIAYIEFKVGNKDGVKYEPGIFIDEYLDRNRDGKEETPVQKTKIKYEDFLKKCNIYSLSSCMEIEIVNKYIENQLLEEDCVVEEFSSYQLFLSPRKEENWVKLSRFETLEDSEFTRIYSEELEKLKNAEILDFKELLTFMSHIFYFDKEGIVKENIDAILEYADTQVDKIFNNIGSFIEIKNTLIKCWNTKGLSKRFITFIKKTLSKLEASEKEEAKRYVQLQFSKLKNGDTYFLDYIDSTLPKSDYTLKGKPYLKYLESLDFYSYLQNLSNTNLIDVYDYLEARYNGHDFSLTVYKEELPFIKGVRDQLESQELNGIRGWWMRRIGRLCDETINKMQS